MRYSKQDDIDTLMSHAYKELQKIRIEYGSALHSRSIPSQLLVDIKNYLENLRSSLEYLAKSMGNAKSDFPVTLSQTEFDNKTSGLDVKAKAVFAKYQKFNDGNWLSNFSTLNNKNKHVGLTPQVRLETRTQSISHQDVSITIGEGASIQLGEGATISLGGATIHGGQTLQVGAPLRGDSRLKMKEEIWVDFIFDNTDIPALSSDISALPFLEESFTKVSSIIQDAELQLSIK
jgi:hypothetical protein